ncbi:hypothetical protein E1I69_07765 [Bacillus timonensis]|uniref:Uncharacterized protein n=1 Tax=Bacillus timonensis TaxID=1033734 RepID=A0A4S3PUY4_9BACI|nr:hypothetical protein E1I69_07765 [Bacillus timonensis]
MRELPLVWPIFIGVMKDRTHAEFVRMVLHRVYEDPNLKLVRKAPHQIFEEENVLNSQPKSSSSRQ